MIRKDNSGKDITPVSVKDLYGHLRFDGRNLYYEDSILFGWECSSFEFCGEFEGEISMDVEIVNNYYVDVTHRILFYVVVDGVPNKIGPYTDEPTNIVLCNVKKGFHTIKVIKNTAPIFNKYTLKALRYNGTIAEKLPDRKLNFEFVGDSITAGSCVMSYEGKEPDLDLDTSAEGYYNYPAVLGRNFDANVYDVAIHGFGIVNKEGIFMTNSPDIYDYVDYYHDKETKWDFQKNQADVVVMALGTNDEFPLNGRYKTEQAEYGEIYKNYVRHIRECHPNAFIYCIYGMMYTTFEKLLPEVVAEMAKTDKKIKYIRMPSDLSGGYEHPSKSGHAKFAEILTEDIKKNLGF